MGEKPEKEKSSGSSKDSQVSRKPLIDLGTYGIDPAVLKMIPKDLASHHVLIPLYKNGEVLFVAMADTRDITAIDRIRSRTQLHGIIPLYAPREDILSAIDRHYGLQERMQDILQEVAREKLESGLITESEESDDSLKNVAEQAPVIKLVNHMMMQAVQDQVSDIHLEPDEKVLRVRSRRDGVLQESYVFQKDLESAIIARIKIISGMDIAEKRKPQDGRIRLNLESRQIDVRVSSLPTLYGENLVLRLLDKTSIKKDLAALGMEGSTLEAFTKSIRAPYGIILVTGPTGSGKSTTLYGALNAINDMEKNIVTIEDPVEYNLELIRQTQVNPKVGLTFASGLRSILRQDPDIIMVGEIRDPETAEIAVQAALTGHLVLSTLHTNDACGAVTRLQDMGIQPFLIANALVGVLAQRLVRTLCEDCREPFDPPDSLRGELNIQAHGEEKFYTAKGCNACGFQGYRGRTTIHEFLKITPGMRDLITGRASQREFFDLGLREGMIPLRESGIVKAARSLTSLQEVIKVTA